MVFLKRSVTYLIHHNFEEKQNSYTVNHLAVNKHSIALWMKAHSPSQIFTSKILAQAQDLSFNVLLLKVNEVFAHKTAFYLRIYFTNNNVHQKTNQKLEILIYYFSRRHSIQI